jgi:hypothetical protein
MQDYSTYGGDPSNMMAAMGPYVMVIGLVGLAICIFWIFIQWKIFSKAGHPGWLALSNILLFIPLINLLGIFVVLGIWIWFAFSDWPALKRTA